MNIGAADAAIGDIDRGLSDARLRIWHLHQNDLPRSRDQRNLHLFPRSFFYVFAI